MSDGDETKAARLLPADGGSSSELIGQWIGDLSVPADRIRYFANIDLGTLDQLPTRREDLIAISIRMEASFDILCDSVLELIAQDFDEIRHEPLEKVTTELALAFIERYGLLALMSSDLLRVLWAAQRPDSKHGPSRLREVGERLATFALANKGTDTAKTIDISFTLFKPHFLAELQQLSHELGALAPDKARADQMLDLVESGRYQMLKMNLRWLEQFLRSQGLNPYLKAKNAISADMLAEYGIGKKLGEKRQPSITPDWFFYTWMAWITNKTPKTVRREIQTAKAKLRRMFTPARVTRNR
jgi:hypothetical protein